MVGYTDEIRKRRRGEGYDIDPGIFMRRLASLYSSWNDHKQDLWSGSDVLAISTPPSPIDHQQRYLKSLALHIWLLGYEFPDTIMVFTQKKIFFLSAQRDISHFFDTLRHYTRQAVTGIDLIVILIKENRIEDQIESILLDVAAPRRTHQCNGGDHRVVVFGYIAEEEEEEESQCSRRRSNLLEKWDEKLMNKFLLLDSKKVDVSNGFSELFSVKDETELHYMRQASCLSASALDNFVFPRIAVMIRDNEKVAHSALMEETKKALLDPLTQIMVQLRNVDVCYPPCFQSGGNYDLDYFRYSTSNNNNDHLYYDSKAVIICAIGARHNKYCSNAVRTYLIEPNALHRRAYKALFKAHEEAIAALMPGNKVGAAYQAAFALVQREAPEFLANLTETAGAGIGIQFCESDFILNARNDRELKAGMVFNVSLGFHNLQAHTNNPKTESFSLLLADMVIVTETIPEVATAAYSTKTLKTVSHSYYFPFRRYS